MKIAIIVGHNSVAQGVYSPRLGISEYSYWRKVANRIKELDQNIDIYFREHSNSYTKEIQKVLFKINKIPYDLVLELHFNSAGEKANGVEVLYFYKNLKAKEYSEKFQELANKNFGSNKRKNIAVEKQNQRGGYGILNSKGAYILTELFFGSNEESLKFKDTNKIANFYLDFLSEISDKSIGIKKESFWKRLIKWIFKIFENTEGEK